MEEASSVCCSSNHTPSHTHSSLAHGPNQTSCNLSFGCELGRQRWVTFSFRLDDNPPSLKAGQSNPMADIAREEYTIVTFMEHQLIFPQRARGEREREEKNWQRVQQAYLSSITPLSPSSVLIFLFFSSEKHPKPFSQHALSSHLVFRKNEEKKKVTQPS